MKTKRNRVVVITGASSGFGRGAALRFAKAGDNVVIAARRESLLEDVAKQCRKSGGEALVVEADVSKAADVEHLAEQTLDKFGHIDVWVNNAGVGTVARFDEAPLEEHEQVIRTNLLGTIYGSYEALNQFRQQGEGVLINLASFAGKVAPPYMSSYAASKFGIRGLGMALREELAQNGEDNIRVSTIMPVSFDTPFFEHAGNHTGKPVKPIGTVYDPKEVIETIFEMSNDPEDEVVVGTEGKLSSIAQRLSPKLVEKQMAKQTQKAQMGQKESAKSSSGSVFRPMKSGKDVYGGWTGAGQSSADWRSELAEPSIDSGSGAKRSVGVVAGIAVPVGMGIAYWLRQRRQRKDRWEQAA
jgi:short-subunit dehydrogenase